MRLFLITILMFVSAASAWPQARVKGVNFEGNSAIEDDALLEQMNTQPKSGFAKLMFWKKRPDFIRPAFEQDIERLKSYYTRNGFLDPLIAVDLDSSRSGKLISINIRIGENEFVSIGDLVFNFRGDSTTRRFMDSLEKAVPLRSGIRFRDEDVFTSQTMITEKFSDNGYPYIRANYEINLNRDSLLADVAFDVTPGNKSFFGSVTITGDSLIPEKFFGKYLRFKPGQLYSQERIDSTQQDLYGTDLFQYVVISSKKDSAQDNRIPVEITVKELPRWRLETGIGYGTEDRVRLSAGITRRNFLGGTRRLIVNAKTSYFLPFFFDVRFVQPDFLLPKLDLILNPFYMRERERGYRIDRAGGGINFVYRITRRLDANLSYSFERDRILEISDLQLDPSELKHNKSVIGIGSRYNSTNSLFYPSAGQKTELAASLAGIGFSGDVHYYKIEGSHMRYIGLADEFVLALRLRSGIVKPTGSGTRTPVEERFYLGGASSLRGWPRHAVVPEAEAVTGLGGNTLLEASAELRFPVYGVVHGAVFSDAGNVWTGSWEYHINDLRYNVGAGIRVRTPIGPLRLDFATPVFEKPKLQFFLSIGHAF